MANRTAKFVSAIFASVLAGAPLATLSHSAARAADDCLAAPKDETPEGGHWYYRIDHASKRQCWYLREEGEKLSQGAAPNSSRSTKPIPPKAASPIQRSIADAHAELPAQTNIEQPRRNDALIPSMPSGAAATENNVGTQAPGAATLQSAIAWRWPDPSSAWRSPDPSSADVSAAATPNSGNPVTSVSSPSRSQPLLAAGQLAAAADLSPETPAYSVRMELAMLLGALALAGFAGGAIFKLVSRRRPRRAKVRRGAIWERSGSDSIPLSALPRANVVPSRPVLVRDLDQSSDDATDRIEEFILQFSKRAQF
jgi:hypothetical protein